MSSWPDMLAAAESGVFCFREGAGVFWRQSARRAVWTSSQLMKRNQRSGRESGSKSWRETLFLRRGSTHHLETSNHEILREVVQV